MSLISAQQVVAGAADVLDVAELPLVERAEMLLLQQARRSR